MKLHDRVKVGPQCNAAGHTGVIVECGENAVRVAFDVPYKHRYATKHDSVHTEAWFTLDSLEIEKVSLDNTLKALLRYVKQADFDTTWQAVRDNVFAPLYHSEMRFQDVMEVLLKAYERAKAEPRFELPASRTGLYELVMAPVTGFHALNYLRVQLDTQYTVEQFYGSIITKVLSDLRMTRVDWCKDELTV